MLKCRECKECNGYVCRGEIPGLGGKGTGSSFIRNVEAFKKIKLNLDVCADAKEISTACNILGMELSVPIFVAPIAGINNNYGAELSDHDYTSMVLEGAENAGIRAFTGDGIDVNGLFKESAEAIDEHNGHGIVTMKPWVQEGIDERVEILKSLHFDMLAMDVDSAGLPLLRAGKTPVETKNVEALRYVRKKVGKPFIVKGIMTVHGALAALESGASGIVVSNHGGRVLDETRATVEVLPEIVEAVNGRMTILIDGGIRTGRDIYKCLALGADGVLIGRPLALATVKGGAKGLEDKVNALKNELSDAMLMTGKHIIKEISKQDIYME